MAPKGPNVSNDRPFNLSDTETTVALYACKLLADTGKVDQDELAKLTGHDKPSSAYRIWFNAKKKMGTTNAPASSFPPATDTDAAPVKKPAAKRVRKPKTKGDAPPATEEDGDDGDEMEPEKPAKRVKTEKPSKRVKTEATMDQEDTVDWV